MTEELVKQWDEYVESMGSVMGDVEHMTQQMRDRIEQLTGEVQRWQGMFDEKHNLMLEHKARADRIEQLTAERDHAWEMAAKADAQMGQSLADHLQAKAERDRLRALLAEADRRIAWEAHGFGNDFAERVEAAALKGETP